jgi:hypothetical protein
MRHAVPNSVNVSTWLSLRFERGTRYCQLHLEQDLLGRLDLDHNKWAAQFATGARTDDLAGVV